MPTGWEEVFLQIFLEQYKAWWLQSEYQDDDDIQFGVLVLRLCVKRPLVQDMIDAPLNAIEARCYAAASKLDDCS